AMLERAIAATSDRRWTIAGPGRWLEDPWDALTRAEVVVTAAGQNAIADVAAAGARAVVVPRPRPFDEQRRTAERLDADGLAVLAEETTDAWPELLARRLPSNLEMPPTWSTPASRPASGAGHGAMTASAMPRPRACAASVRSPGCVKSTTRRPSSRASSVT
ncbi:glycosyltransferase, partial [Burkholderia cenocepacia]|uniref:glycosyltransferase n=1 Tax=Burkholderia cenocepacia TaxID=95486 RepID=UPI0038CC0CBD